MEIEKKDSMNEILEIRSRHNLCINKSNEAEAAFILVSDHLMNLRYLTFAKEALQAEIQNNAANQHFHNSESTCVAEEAKAEVKEEKEEVLCSSDGHFSDCLASSIANSRVSTLLLACA